MNHLGKTSDVERINWQLSKNLGWHYMRVSGDFNPAHLLRWGARFLGFGSAVIHGMWSKARILSALLDKVASDSFIAKAVFKRPIVLPANVSLTYQVSSYIDFNLSSLHDNCHNIDCFIEGEIQPL